jgi:esterase/lipase superfamily enzyme
MFLINTRKRNPDNTFGHERLPKGDYAVYEISKASTGKDAEKKTLDDIPTNKDTLLLVHGFNNDFDEVTAAYLAFARKVRQAGFKLSRLAEGPVP